MKPTIIAFILCVAACNDERNPPAPVSNGPDQHHDFTPTSSSSSDTGCSGTDDETTSEESSSGDDTTGEPSPEGTTT